MGVLECLIYFRVTCQARYFWGTEQMLGSSLCSRKSQSTTPSPGAKVTFWPIVGTLIMMELGYVISVIPVFV